MREKNSISSVGCVCIVCLAAGVGQQSASELKRKDEDIEMEWAHARAVTAREIGELCAMLLLTCFGIADHNDDVMMTSMTMIMMYNNGLCAVCTHG